MNLSAYLSADGTQIAFLEKPDNGAIPPPVIAFYFHGQQVELGYCGTPSSMFAKLNYHYKQAEIAAMVGVTQQSVSRYAEGAMRPWLSDAGWRALGVAYRGLP